MRKKLKVCFIPHEDNNHQPYFLRDKATKMILGFVLLLQIGLLALLLPVLPGKLSYLSAILPGVLILEANETRSDLSLGELKNSQLLQVAAQLKANDMAEKGYFSHITPDGKSPWYFLGMAGYQHDIAGENLAVNFVDSKDVHRAWMNSPTHKANIVRGDFTEVGIATAKGMYKGKEVIFVAQFFGKPKQAYIPPQDIPKEIIVNEIVEIPVQEIVEIEEPVEEVQGALIESESFVEINNSASIKESSAKLLSSPRTLVSTILVLLSFLVLIALFLKIVIKVKIQYKGLILNGVLLAVIIVSVIIFNDQLAQYLGQID